MAVVIAGTLYWGYNTIYDRGFKAAEVEWVEKLDKMEKARDERIATIEGFAKTTLEQTLLNNVETQKDIDAILLKVRGKPLTSAPCTPTDDFVSSYNAVIQRSNKK
jgi:hypothetical protein